MKFIVIACGLFITSAILYSARFITSAIIVSNIGVIGDSITISQTLPLLILSVITAVLAIAFLLLSFKSQ